MKIAAILLASFFALSVHAAEGKKKESHHHREHGAHQHGHGELSIAFEGTKGRLEFKTPADSIYGFEHEPKTVAQKKKVEEASKKFESSIGEMVKWDASLGCKYANAKTETLRDKDEANHSEFSASFDIVCDKSPAGTTVTFDFPRVFPKLRDVDATVLVDNLQKSADIKKPGTPLDLK